MGRTVLVLMTLLLNAALAGPRKWVARVGLSSLDRVPARAIRIIERKLNRDHRDAKIRETRGTMLVIATIAVCVIAGGLGHWLLGRNLRFIELLIVMLALPVRPTWDTVADLHKALHAGDIPAAKEALSGTAWRHYALLDQYGVARAGIEMLAVHFAEKIVAPVFWYGILGLPGLLVSKTVYLLHETLASTGAGAQEFGRTPQAVYYVLHYIPSRIAAGLWLVASIFLPPTAGKEALLQVKNGLLAASPPVLALLSAASVLKVSLGGPASIYAHDWIGSGAARVGVYEVKRALTFFLLLHLLLFVLLGLFL